MKEEKRREREDLKERHVTKSPHSITSDFEKTEKSSRSKSQAYNCHSEGEECFKVDMDNVLSALQSFV